MTSEAMLEGAVLFVSAIVLGLAHVWNYNCHGRRKAEAEDALRLQSIRQKAVQQLKSEHRMWSVAAQRTRTGT
jgi:hypothetical protein